MSADYKQITQVFGKPIVSTRLATTAATTIYTVPASTTVRLTRDFIANRSGSPVTITVTLAVSELGGTARALMYQTSLAANDMFYDVLAGLLLAPGDVLAVTAGTADVIDVTVCGFVST
jgi:hypothetical protein